MGKLFNARTARCLALAAALCAALVVSAEAGLRIARIGTPVWHRPDPMLGWALRPYAGSHGGGQAEQINAFGQRDNPHGLDKRPGVYRIAVLGDERSEALSVRLRETWWRRLALELDRCGFAPGKRIEMLNFGVAGYSTAQEALVLESEVLRYRPDLVLLQFSAGKDVRENSRTLATRLDRPFFSLDPHGLLRFDATFRTAPEFNARSQFRYELARSLSDHSRLLRIVGRIDLVRSAHAKAAGAPPRPETAGDPHWEEAWRITEALLERMRGFSVRNGARFAVVGAPARAPLAPAGDSVDVRLAGFAASRGIAYIRLAPSLAGGARDLYGTDGQWTVAGHRAAAQAVAAGLCRVTPKRWPAPG